MRSMHLWHVTECGWVVSDILDQLSVPPSRVQQSNKYVTTNLWCVKHPRTVKISGTTVLSLLEDTTPHTNIKWTLKWALNAFIWFRQVQWTVRFQALKASSFLPANVFPHTTLHYGSQPKALITSKGYHIPVNRMVWRGMQYSTGDEEGAVSWDFCLWPLHSKTTDCASPLPTICTSQGKPTSKEN